MFIVTQLPGQFEFVKSHMLKKAIKAKVQVTKKHALPQPVNKNKVQDGPKFLLQYNAFLSASNLNLQIIFFFFHYFFIDFKGATEKKTGCGQINVKQQRAAVHDTCASKLQKPTYCGLLCSPSHFEVCREDVLHTVQK